MIASNLIASSDALAIDNLRLVFLIDQLNRDNAELLSRLRIAERAQEATAIECGALASQLADARDSIRRRREREG